MALISQFRILLHLSLFKIKSLPDHKTQNRIASDIQTILFSLLSLPFYIFIKGKLDKRRLKVVNKKLIVTKTEKFVSNKNGKHNRKLYLLVPSKSEASPFNSI